MREEGRDAVVRRHRDRELTGVSLRPIGVQRVLLRGKPFAHVGAEGVLWKLIHVPVASGFWTVLLSEPAALLPDPSAFFAAAFFLDAIVLSLVRLVERTGRGW
jgi:hypothetical protein